MNGDPRVVASAAQVDSSGTGRVAEVRRVGEVLEMCPEATRVTPTRRPREAAVFLDESHRRREEVWKEIEAFLKQNAHRPQILAPDDAGGHEWSLKEPESLIRFVKVEDVYLKNDLYMIMQRLGAEEGFAEFASANRFGELCKAAYNHVRSYGWLFDHERGSPDYGRQVIRTPGDVLRDQKGCCLDLACLFAALLENMQVKPVILRVFDDRSAHAVAGYWKDDGAGPSVIREEGFVRKAVRGNDLVLFETTGAVRTPSPIGGEPRQWREEGDGFLSFEEAVKTAHNLVLSTSVQIDFLLDVVAAREV